MPFALFTFCDVTQAGAFNTDNIYLLNKEMQMEEKSQTMITADTAMLFAFPSAITQPDGSAIFL